MNLVTPDHNPITVGEHWQDVLLNDTDASYLSKSHFEATFAKKRGGAASCFEIRKDNNSGYSINTGYFIGVDWLDEGQSYLCVEPKLNNDTGDKVDYIKMLFEALEHPEANNDSSGLFAIDWDRPQIDVEQSHDMLTPLLAVQYLLALKSIVRKGLKKSYYRVERNLHSRVKGKVMVGTTIKKNLLQNKKLHTYCQFEEFGVDNEENRLLNKALVFVKRYLSDFPTVGGGSFLVDTLNFITPAFHGVGEEVSLHDMRHGKKNAFYKEYVLGTKLARLILKRFGYNLNNIGSQRVAVPPFWIDMATLFELYVLGLLRKQFGSAVHYHVSHRGNELDYLINDANCRMVVDAKYIPSWDYRVKHENVRQVSGYARLSRVYDRLGIEKGRNIDCLIIYPVKNKGWGIDKDDITRFKVDGYEGIYKLGVSVPWIARK